MNRNLMKLQEGKSINGIIIKFAKIKLNKTEKNLVKN